MSDLEKALIIILIGVCIAWYFNAYEYHIPNLVMNKKVASAGNTKNSAKFGRINQWAAKLPDGQWRDSILKESKNYWQFRTVAQFKEEQRKKDSILLASVIPTKDSVKTVLGPVRTVILTTGGLQVNTVEENNGTMNITSSDDLELGYFKTYEPTCGVRFDSVVLPRFSILEEPGKVGEIVGAYIQFTAKATSSGTVCIVPIFGIDADDAGVFNTIDSDLMGREETTAALDWELSSSSWTAGDKTTEQKTPDLKAIVQEILERTGWASGNAIAFKLKSKTGNTGFRNAASSTHETHNGPELVVKYRVWEVQ